MIKIELEALLRKNIRKKILESYFKDNISIHDLKLILEQSIDNSGLVKTRQQTTASKRRAMDAYDRIKDTPPALKAKKAAAKKQKLQAQPSLIFSQEATNAKKKEILDAAALFEKGPDLITTSEASSIAEMIYTATKEGTWSNLFTGAGTDEAAIRTALDRCPTLLDVSLVSEVFEKQYAGSWTFTPNLIAVFKSELDQGDLNQYVTIPLAEKPFLSINDQTYTKEEFNKLIKESGRVTKTTASGGDTGFVDGVSDTAAGIAVSASIGFGIDAAVGIYAAAPVIAAKYAAGGTVAAMGTTIGSGVGAGAAGLATISTGGLALLVILGVGIGSYFIWGDAPTVDEQTKMALSSKAYKQMTSMFTKLAGDLKQQAQTVRVMIPEVIPEEEEEEEELPPDKKEEETKKIFPALIFTGLVEPYVKNIQIAMNEYCISRNISRERIAEDGQMGPDTRGRWHASSTRSDWFAIHALRNHSVFKTSQGSLSITTADLQGRDSWKRVSSKLIGEFPGYTPNRRGMLAFCVDAYYDNTEYGKVARAPEKEKTPEKKEPKKKSSKTTPVMVPPTMKEPERKRATPERTTAGGFGPGNITIRVGGLEHNGVRNINQLIGPGVKTDLARTLISRIKSGRQGLIMDNTESLNLSIKVDKGTVQRVDKVRGQTGDFRHFQSGTYTPTGVLYNFLKNYKIKPGAIKGSKIFTLNITFPAGYYNPSK